MSLRSALAARIPELHLVEHMTIEEARELLAGQSLVHQFMVRLDILAGVLFRRLCGVDVPNLTISARVALSLRARQTHGQLVAAPLPLLLLGAFLEFCEYDHLNIAIEADHARGVLEAAATSGAIA